MFINLEETRKKRLRSTESGMCYSKDLPVCKKRGGTGGRYKLYTCTIHHCP